jgi:hypothetical protein
VARSRCGGLWRGQVARARSILVVDDELPIVDALADVLL